MIFEERGAFPLFRGRYFLTQYTISRLSNKRIIVSLLMIFFLRPLAEGIRFLTGDSTLGWMFALNILGSLLIIYDWNLFGIHYNRAKSNKGDFMIFFGLGLFLIGTWAAVDIRFLGGNIPLPESTLLKNDLFAVPAVFAAFSFLQSTIVNIGFKCLTDHLKVRSNELLIIFLSGILFGLVYTIVFLPVQPALIPRTLLYNIVLLWILSYLYNQSNSFMPGLCAMTVIYLFLQITLL